MNCVIWSGKPRMINYGAYQACVCQRVANVYELCDGVNGFSEQGKKIRFTTRPGESVDALVIDDCVLTDNQPKCDGLFVFTSPSKNALALVELKGSDIAKAFAQLSFVKQHRQEYQHIKQLVSQQVKGFVKETAYIVSNFKISKVEKEKLEQQHAIRVKAVLHCEATTPVPDLRKQI